MLVYKYSSITGELLGSEEADESPLEPGQFLVPAYATSQEPPKVGSREVAVFESEAWSVKPDLRGTSYWLSYGESKTITTIGETIPENASTSQPDAPLSTVQTDQILLLRKACTEEMISGFSSEALGEIHTYPSTKQDQANLNASVVISLVPGKPADWTIQVWCQDSSGTWDFKKHTSEQVQQVGLDGKTFLETLQTKLKWLVEQVTNATTPEEVTAITWK